MIELDDETLLLVDGDAVAYRAAFANAKTEDWHNVEWYVDNFIARLKHTLGFFRMKVYLTGSTNFRNDLAVTHPYKGNRPPKPEWLADIRSYLEHFYDTEMAEGLEADDLIAMKMTRNPKTICCSIDKDLRTVEGWHYSWSGYNYKEKPLEYITEHGYIDLAPNRKKLNGGGNMLLYSQALTGDNVDNIKGPKGYGPVKAYEALMGLETERCLYETVLQEYEQHFDNPVERLHENMNLLYMIRKLDENNKPVLWRVPE